MHLESKICIVGYILQFDALELLIGGTVLPKRTMYSSLKLLIMATTLQSHWHGYWASQTSASQSSLLT